MDIFPVTYYMHIGKPHSAEFCTKNVRRVLPLKTSTANYKSIINLNKITYRF